jgi:hypothetical protein
VSFIGAWFFAGILADYVRLWPREWAVLQNTAIAAASWQFMNHICWFLVLFLILRIIFIFVEGICSRLQDISFLKELFTALGGFVGVAEAMMFVLVLSIAFNSPMFKNGAAAVENTFISKVNEVTSMVYDRFLEPLYDADAFTQAYQDASSMTDEQRQHLKEWLEEQGYTSEVQGITEP